MTKHWRNWARTERSRPALEIAPRSIEHVVAAIERARETGHSVKPIGASHSFSGIGATDGIRLNFDRLRGLARANLETREVTFWAGTHLREIPNLLAPLGLALENMGDIDRQTLSGAVQTGTHGTGTSFGGFPTQVTALTMVTGTGEVRVIDESTPDLLRAAALGLGALGVVVDMTLRCVPHYLLEAYEEAVPLAHMLEEFTETVRDSDHFEFFWFPHTDVVRTKRNTRHDPRDTEKRPLTSAARVTEEELMNNTLFGALNQFGSIVPRATPPLNRLVASVGSSRHYIDDWHRVFVSPRRVKFRESEFAVPIDAVPEAVADLQRMIERRRFSIAFPIEVRTAAADSIMLSTAHGRTTGYIAIHQFIGNDHREYFAEAERVMQDYGGRPHWGKMHNLTADRLHDLYPKFDAFLAIRNELDPDRVFSNEYLTRVLGA